MQIVPCSAKIVSRRKEGTRGAGWRLGGNMGEGTFIFLFCFVFAKAGWVWLDQCPWLFSNFSLV